jgi:peptidoglycan hydrolase-like protein with peptidoglycan-binding domain
MADFKAAQEMCSFANQQVKNGSIYVLGAQGQTGSQITEAWIKKREHNVASNYKRAIALWKKRLAAGYTSLCAYDCSGLVVKWLMDNGYLKSDKTANGLYFDACSAISKSTLQTGDLVFKKYSSKNRMYHVGIYMGDGTVVHAKGRDSGVVREAISADGWNRYGRLISFGATGYTRLLKLTTPYMNGADVAAVQAALADKGYSPGSIDGYYGPATEKAVVAFQKASKLEADGIVGPLTWGALFDSAESDPETPDVPEAPAPVFTRNLQYTPNRYMIGVDVATVQAALLAHGFDPQGIDGSFGPETESAVKAFQKANGLEVDGIVGTLTWAALFNEGDDGEDDSHEVPQEPETPAEPAVKYTRLLKNTGKPYMNGADAKAVQTALLAAGYDPKGVDGSFGPNTEAAIKAYQAKNGLEVDGIVGPETWAKLMG